MNTSLFFRTTSAVNAFFFPEFFRLKLATSGMLPVRVYRELYNQVRALPDLDIVEVGAGSGTSTIAMALALRDTGRRARIVSVEKCEGGSRLDYGDRAANLTLLENNLVQFGVRDRVTIYPHALTPASGPDLKARINSERLAALVHDADGRIDRDFELLWGLLRPGGLIVIDDYENQASYRPASPRWPDGGTKSLLTYRLLNRLIEWGLVARRRVVGNTFFGYKPEHADFARFDAEACHRIAAQVEHERDTYLKTHPTHAA